MLDLRQIGKIVVTGATGFLGQQLLQALRSRGCQYAVHYPREQGSWKNDLLHYDEAELILGNTDVVFHTAALCGGIGANQARPADFIMRNLLMGMNVIRACLVNGVKKLVIVGTLCAFPKDIDRPIEPEDLWTGYPEATNAPYGIAKRTLAEMSKAYRQQYGMNIVNVMPTNLYGPHDNFDPDSSHVIPAMIRKFSDAKQRGHQSVTCWGTGKPTRDFLHASDAIEGIIRAAERIDDSEPVLLGSGLETTMFGLAMTIANIVGYRGRINWDTTKPDGQPRRVVSTRSQRERLDFVPQMNLRDGLEQTVKWWQESTKCRAAS